MSKKDGPKKKLLVERITLLSSPGGQRLDLPVGTTAGGCRDNVATHWNWAAARIQLFGPMGALIWDDSQTLKGGTIIASLAPWPMTVVVQLPSFLRQPGEQSVCQKIRMLLPSGGRGKAGYTRASASRQLTLAPEIFELVQLPQEGEAATLGDEQDLEELCLKTVILRVRPHVQRVLAELLRIEQLWTASKLSRRPPPKAAWEEEVFTGMTNGLETLKALVERGVASEDSGLVVQPAHQDDPMQWRVLILALRARGAPKEPAPALHVTFPAEYPHAPPGLRFSPPFQHAKFHSDGTVPAEALGVLRNWEPSNSLFCAIGELLDLMMLPPPADEPPPRPAVPYGPLS
eukprot:TRINITY_DN111950_c0_g1_i1.p1 TRINITY_DN111950_c0_g1~~TRINITY_DN111950_c0_g1_i1.p1  ORF type:complete len:346 (+),score=49.31 TRINITY_DN111950_c0_g1_i1:93-1130(+)